MPFITEADKQPVSDGLKCLTAPAHTPRKMESEADAIGLTLAARACYNPGAAVSVYQILGGEEAKQGGDHMPSMLRTHPMSSARIEAVSL